MGVAGREADATTHIERCLIMYLDVTYTYLCYKMMYMVGSLRGAEHLFYYIYIYMLQYDILAGSLRAAEHLLGHDGCRQYMTGRARFGRECCG